MADSRRGFLKTVTLLLGTAVGAILALPVVRFVVFPARRRTVQGGGDPVPVASESAVIDGGPPLRVEVIVPEQVDAWSKQTEVRLGAAWLVRRGGTLRAFTTTCPHLGCAIDYDDATKSFRCPCHTSEFGLDGKRVSGPAKRDLDPLEVSVADGRVKLRYEKFVSDVADRRKA